MRVAESHAGRSGEMIKCSAQAAGALIGVALLLGGGAWLRLADLGDRPMHADEATGARILAQRLDTGSEYRFDPTHFHGPLLSMITQGPARLNGETTWYALTKTTLRIAPAVCGSLILLAALAMGPWLGRWGAVAAAAFMASSPLLAYYSRMYIHEMLFGLCALTTLWAGFALAERPTTWRAVACGLGAGLMAATRETAALTGLIWCGVIAMLMLVQHRRSGSSDLRGVVVRYGRYVAGVAATALITAGLFYSDFGRHPAGLVDFFRSYFVYELSPGHEKPMAYYLWLLVWPKHQGGLWWTEAGVAAFAVVGTIACFRGRSCVWIQFLAVSALLHLIAYSLMGYKTPWLMVVPWIQVCLVAGYGAACLMSVKQPAWKAAIGIVVVLVLVGQINQSRRAVFRFASAARNPYAYVPTAPDAERMAAWLAELGDLFPVMREQPVAVVGPQYWPLPWYLRSFPTIGYWPEIPNGAATLPVMIVLPAQAENALVLLDGTHVGVPRGLRTDTPVLLFLRSDIWNAYSEM